MLIYININAIPKADLVEITFYSIQGDLVAKVLRGFYSAGSHEISWNSTSFSKGVYFAKLDTPAGMVTTKFAVVK